MPEIHVWRLNVFLTEFPTYAASGADAKFARSLQEDITLKLFKNVQKLQYIKGIENELEQLTVLQ